MSSTVARWAAAAGAGVVALVSCLSGCVDLEVEPLCATEEARVLRGDCPRYKALGFQEDGCGCGDAAFSFFLSTSKYWICSGNELVVKTHHEAPYEPELCNGRSDNNRPRPTEEEVCLAQCKPDAVAAAVSALVLPTGQEQTTVDGEPQIIGQLTEIPAWCEDPGAFSPTAGDVWVRCGEVLSLSGVTTSRLRVAPGGVLRVSSSTLSVGELLVCPNGVVQGSESSSRALTVEADHWLHYGSMHLEGGSLEARVDRLLLAGEVSTQGRVGKDSFRDETHAEASGSVRIEARDEAFLSGRVVTAGGDGGAQLACGPGGRGAPGGTLELEVPVCCQGVSLVTGDGRDGAAGLSEDPWEEGNSVRFLEPGDVIDAALCEMEDFFLIEVEIEEACEARVWLEFDASEGADMDLLVVDVESNALVTASMTTSAREEVFVPAGRHAVIVQTLNEARGAYRIGRD